MAEFVERDIWCPHAEERPLPENRTQRLKSTPGNLPAATVDHTAVDAPGRTNLWAYFARSDVGAESTGWVYRTGDAEQFMSCDVVANANRRADSFADSWETEDDGDPERWEWTDAQLETLARIHTWECLTFSIPARPCAGPYLPAAAGLGYHAQWRTLPGGNPWTSYQGKTCPGSKRIAQWWGELLPEIQRRVAASNPTPGPEELIVTPEDAELVRAIVREEMGAVVANVGQVKADLAQWEQDTRILLEGCTVRAKGDAKQFLLAAVDGGLVKVHVPDPATLSLLQRSRVVGPSEAWNLVEVDGAEAEALAALPEA